jgi:selenocysteine lyase/cysteine desulfurase
MLSNRRKFMKGFAGAASLLSLSALERKLVVAEISDSLSALNAMPVSESISDEDLWAGIRQAFTVNPNILNLNNGGVSPQPKVVQDANDRYYRYSNEGPTYYMWRILDQGREPLRSRLAEFAGCSADEIAINRNATEAIDTVIFGLDLKPGDEVILTKQDYPNMIQAWKQREMRDGIKLVWLNFDLPIEEDEIFVKGFRDAITERTRVFHITHMINWTGQVLPVKKLCDLARSRNIFSLVDGAHTFAHLQFEIPELNCDAFGTSLHKWMCAPFGTGLLYLRKDKIADIWPMMPNLDPKSGDIRKFENLGTRSFAPEQAIGTALDFHLAIGSERKEKRLYYLSQYWVDKVKNHPRIRLNTSTNPKYACALFNFSIEGVKPEDVASRLFSEFKIHTVAIVWENISGIRVTPHVYTSAADLDRFSDAVLKIASA